MPGTSDAAENNLALTKRAVLMLADVRDGGDFSIVFENRDALAGKTDDARAIFGNFGDGAGVNEAILVAADVRRRILLIEHFRLLTSAATNGVTGTVQRFLPLRCHDVQSQNRDQAERRRANVNRAAFALQYAESNMQHEQRVRD